MEIFISIACSVFVVMLLVSNGFDSVNKKLKDHSDALRDRVSLDSIHHWCLGSINTDLSPGQLSYRVEDLNSRVKALEGFLKIKFVGSTQDTKPAHYVKKSKEKK